MRGAWVVLALLVGCAASRPLFPCGTPSEGAVIARGDDATFAEVEQHLNAVVPSHRAEDPVYVPRTLRGATAARGYTANDKSVQVAVVAFDTIEHTQDARSFLDRCEEAQTCQILTSYNLLFVVSRVGGGEVPPDRASALSSALSNVGSPPAPPPDNSE